MAARVHSEVEMSWIPRPSQRVMSLGSQGVIQSTPAMRDWTTLTPRRWEKVSAASRRAKTRIQKSTSRFWRDAGDTDDLGFTGESRRGVRGREFHRHQHGP